MSVTAIRLEMDTEQMQKIFGMQDAYIKKLEQDFQVTIVDRNGSVMITGEEENVSKASRVLRQLTALSDHGNEIEEQSVDYAIEMGKEDQEEKLMEMDADCICHTISGKPIKPKTLGQKAYVDAIRKQMIVFGIGPAGTGKTYLAMAMAITAFKNEEVNRIILTRPAIEAGEKLGFLPGEMKDKLDPYLQPLYDALQDMVPGAKLKEYMENNVIQIAPLAFMRGRTLNDAVIILDEAQNTTTHQIKMFLTRLGMNAKMIITGDVTQIDLPPTATSGLVQAMQILKGVKGIGKVEFEKKDIVRHKLVQRIVEAYDKFDSKHGKGGSRTVSKEQQEEIKNNINNSQDAR